MSEVETIAVLEAAGYEEDWLLCPECGCETLTKDKWIVNHGDDEIDGDGIWEHRRICPSCLWRDVTYD